MAERSPDNPTSPEQLYLALLKRCLTREGFDERGLVHPGTLWKQRLWCPIEGWLKRRGLESVTCEPDNPGGRTKGLDWPTTAETMIGRRRLDSVQFCIDTVLADRIPGDLIETGVGRGGRVDPHASPASGASRDRPYGWVADSFQGLPKPDGRFAGNEGDSH